ncbi:DUF3347 domain-containing protein [Daejeonella oryzae]|uniref:DUF3347 domain-containing protein n=1 Tax=Daejeonella oryzae TaxID=1122943 RepID=UPI000428EA76|nr:DUF3347 domain-containing protein [Daejeonella oryzae]
MKTLISSIALSTFFFVACNNGNQTTKMDKNTSSTSTVDQGTKEDLKTAAGSISGLLTNYLQIKNALSKDNDQEAATAAKDMVNAFGSFDKAALTTEQAKVYNDIEEDALQHATHIADNSGKIDHQREHFEILSKDIYDLVKEMGAGQKLYYTNCPMYNNNKGANWLSETKEVQNPYLGQSMPTCGTVKEELN